MSAEHDLQRAVADVFRVLLPPEAVWFSVDHGVHASAAAAGQRKARGGIAGIPDMWVFWRGRAVPIELKTERGRVSPDQVALHERMAGAGFPVAVCRSVESVLETLRAAGLPVRGRLAA